LKIGVSLN